jgi:GxxExxY protein
MKKYESIDNDINEIGKQIVNSAFLVHKQLGPGLLEKVYEVCFTHELKKCGLLVERELTFPIIYDNIEFDEALRLDVLVEKKVIIELKAVDLINPVWEAQVLSHLRLTQLRLGYLINFNVPLIKYGIKRYVI